MIKKGVFLILFFASTSFAFADTQNENDIQAAGEETTFVSADSQATPAPNLQNVQGSEKLVGMDLSRVLVRLNDLERRVQDLDLENRRRSEEIRSLDRSVESLKRRS